MSKATETGQPLGLGSSAVVRPDPERAAFDAWFAAATFETMGVEWQWAAWQAGAAAERERIAVLAKAYVESIEGWDFNVGIEISENFPSMPKA